MRILRMNATYGRLQQAQLELGPGLNLICAPNEAGKSTWSSFLCTMLYGLPTRVRGPMADKNRYAPWNGQAMQGSMELETGGERWTVLRQTRQAGAPMQSFRCTYSGTATDVPGVTGQNLGQTLLGVGREVYQRSAFIAQAALKVDQDPELERRIAALLSTGQEEVSYSESYERLKKQLTRHQYNKSGSIPRLEAQQAQLEQQLEELERLGTQAEEARQALEQAQGRLRELQQRQEQWELLEKQELLRRRQQAQEELQEARRQQAALEQLAGQLPEPGELARLQGRMDNWQQGQEPLRRAQAAAVIRTLEADQTREALEAHPLYPAEQSPQRPELPKQPGILLPLLAALLLCAAGGCWVLLSGSLRLALALMAACGGVGLLGFDLLRRRRVRRQTENVRQQQEQLERQIADYRALQDEVEQSREAARQAEADAQSLSRDLERQLLELLVAVRRFRPEVVGAEGIQLALSDAARQHERLAEGRRNVEQQELRCQLLQERPLTPPLPDPGAELPRPMLSREQLRDALPAARQQVQTARSRLDSLSGRLRAMESRESLLALRERCQEELARQRAEYAAIRLAMEALESANRTLQNRFSPALGAETARIFSALTGGRYDRVLLDRELRLSAQGSGEEAARQLEQLSRGAGDQLYLAARLAICHLVLPPEHSAPLVLDDALAYFDDTRLAAALDWLVQEGRTRQVLLFSCHHREQALLAARDDVHLVQLG